MPRKSSLKLPALDLSEETVGQRIARIRKERGYTQIELAERIGTIQAFDFRLRARQVAAQWRDGSPLCPGLGSNY